MLPHTPPDLAADPACNAIRAIDDISPSAVQRILNTLACSMKAAGYRDTDVEMIDNVADTIGPL